MAEKTYGYIRVSSKEQNTDRQRIALCQFGVADGDIFTDRQSGKEILEQWRLLTKEKKVGVVVLDMPLLDTRQGRDLTGTLIADIVLQLLSYVAQTERELIRQRQAEGIAAAKARGVKFGRPPMAWPEGSDATFRSWEAGKLSARRAARDLGVSAKTFHKWADQRSAAHKSQVF